MHQIEIKVIKARPPCGFNRRQSLSAVVYAPQLQQMLIVKTLDANGQAIDPSTAKAAKFALLCGTWISLKGNLDIRLKADKALRGIEYLAYPSS